MIANAIEKVGADGVLSIENGSGLETVVEVEEGMEIDRGYISPQFVTNNEKLAVEFDGARILITDEKIETVKDLVPILEAVSQNGGDPLLIIAEDITGEVGLYKLNPADPSMSSVYACKRRVSTLEPIK